MPLYEYACRRCDLRFEIILTLRERDHAAPCPRCGTADTQRQISPFRTHAWSTFLDGMEKRVSPHKFK